MDEAYLKRRLVRALRELAPEGVPQRHEDKFTGGTPDLSWGWCGLTSWVEVKYSRPGRAAPLTALQAARLDDLRRAGLPAYCLTYCAEVRRGPRAGPKRTQLDDGYALRAAPGFDHDWAARQLRDDHVARTSRALDLVRMFHLKFQIPVGAEPRLEPDLLRRRIKHLKEEMRELRSAAAAADLAGVADALVDLDYLALGTALNLGLPWEALFQDVHRANMAKVVNRAAVADGAKFAVVKPPGWAPPDIRGILERHGYSPTEQEAA